MTIESEFDLEGMKRIGKIVAKVRDEMVKSVHAGITTKGLDNIGEKFLHRYEAKSAPKCEYDFPAATCISINDEAAHGIPGSRKIKVGDSVNIDVSAVLNGYYADTGITIVVGENKVKNSLCHSSKKALEAGIDKARAGVMINQIGKAIYSEAAKRGFTVIKNLTGHGIGRKLHEEPDYILNYYDCRDNQILNEGLVLAIETFLSTGAQFAVEDEDGWTLKTIDGSIVAQFEHTIVVTKEEPIILTA
ncbi:MAG: type I methionyl aminopeptidase [Halanaerobiales bacterium]